MGSKIHLVNNEKIRPGNGGAAFAWNLLTLTDADDIERQIGELRREGSRQVVAARLDEDHIEVGMTPAELSDRAQVDGGILADRVMRTAACFNPEDAVFRQCLKPIEDQSIFSCVDVVGDDGN